MQRASFELLAGALFELLRGLVARRKRAPHMGWEFMWKTGIAEEDVIGKEVGSSPWKREVRHSALWRERDL